MRRAALLLLVAAAAPARAQDRCGPSEPAEPAGLEAGFGRRDITPPAGIGLLGYGPEARVARGVRQPLLARAMALRDARGERLVLAVVDLDFVSGMLHRAVAARVEPCTGLGADRILLSATHTHSGPGNFTGIQAVDDFGTSIPGFNPELQAFLAERIAGAILDALNTLRPARAAWGDTAVWGASYLRSWAAHQNDPHEGWPSRFTPPDAIRDTPAGHVDPTLTVFRVDTVNAEGRAVPAGAWAHFAVHGTGVPPMNDRYDADVQGVAAGALERGIDALRGVAAGGAAPASIAMFANGAEGDVLPETRFDARACATPLLRREIRPGSWRSPPGGDAWVPRKGSDGRKCLAEGLADTRALGERLGREALAVFERLGPVLSADVQVSRMFEMVPLRGPEAPEGICSRGRPGMAQFGGADTRTTRFTGFRWLGLFPAGIEQGGSAVRPSGDCFSPKRRLPRLLEWIVMEPHAFEEAAQFLVARVGNTVLAGVPFEPTTTVGMRMRDAMFQAAQDPRAVQLGRANPMRELVVGLANNYVSYVTTRREYERQHYEGGSTLYGPGSAEVYTGIVARLMRQLRDAGWRSPVVVVDSFPMYPGTLRSRLR